MGKKKDGAKKTSVAKRPKSKCCVSKDRCKRCPIRMLKEGTLPDGYTVHKRKLVEVKSSAQKAGKKKFADAA